MSRDNIRGILDRQCVLIPGEQYTVPTPTQVTLPGDSVAPPPPTPSQAGESFGRYRLRRQLGRGGMGVVYEAWDTQLGRTVALKMLTARGMDIDAAAVARLLREARSAARLRHPHVVAIHDVGEIDGRPYFTMDLVEGRDLEDLFRAPDAWDRFPMRRRVELLAQAAEALGYAHAQGIIHRDIKPSNVMVDSAGQALLMDFGLAKESGSADLTASGAVVGTPRYMSPEQAGGDSIVGPPSDVFAFGVLLYRSITDTLPFEGEGMQAILQTLQVDPPPASRVNPGVQRDLETITMRCLDKDPSRRFSDGSALAAELRRWLDGEPILSRPIGSFERLWRRASKRRAVLVPIVVAAALGVALWASLADRGKKARAAEVAEGARRAAEEQARAQAEALGLLEQARVALAKSQLALYDKGASLDGVVAGVDASRALVERAIALAPDLAPARCLLGACREAAGQDALAEAAYREALRLDPACAVAHFRLGRIALVRTFFEMMGAAGTAIGWRLATARTSVQGAVAELDASLAGAGGEDAEVERVLARAMSAWARADLADARRLCREGLSRLAQALGREELWWLLGVVSEGKEREEALEQAIAIRPRFALALFCRAIVREAKGDLDRAIADDTDAAVAQPRFTAAYVNRGNIRLAQGDSAAAREDYERALAIDPSCAIALVNRSHLHILAGDLDAAVSDCGAAMRAEPGNVMAYLNRADAERRKGDAPAAIADCDKALSLDPGSSMAYANRSTAKWTLHDMRGALADAEEAVRLDRTSASALMDRGVAKLGLGAVEEAIEDFSKAIQADPKRAQAYADRGGAWLRKNELARAREDFDAAVRLDPARAEAWTGLAAVRGTSGDLDGASEDVERALAVAPRNSQALVIRGTLRGMRGDRKGSLADYDAAIAADARNTEAYRKRAEAREAAGDAKGGLSDLDEAVRLEPDSAAMLLARAMARLDAGDAAGAREDADAVVRAEPRNAQAILIRGNTRSAARDLHSAVADYDAALAIDPRLPEAHASRAMALLALGDRSAAVDGLAKALEVAPRDWPHRAQVQATLDKLRGGK